MSKCKVGHQNRKIPSIGGSDDNDAQSDVCVVVELIRI